jgi:hypothetical protein
LRNFHTENTIVIILPRPFLLAKVAAVDILPLLPSLSAAIVHRYDIRGQFIVFASGLSFFLGELQFAVAGVVVPE